MDIMVPEEIVPAIGYLKNYPPNSISKSELNE